ncbi:MAG: DUF4291 family protein, partial [Planctomycetaceae bacterium]
AIASQTLVAPFRRDRMTWIKPSFTWMMYRRRRNRHARSRPDTASGAVSGRPARRTLLPAGGGTGMEDRNCGER